MVVLDIDGYDSDFLREGESREAAHDFLALRAVGVIEDEEVERVGGELAHEGGRRAAAVDKSEVGCL